MLQWGRDEGVAEDLAAADAEATRSWLQWGRDEGVAEDGISFNPGNLILGCFNGAATRVSRKTIGLIVERSTRHPLQWGRDEGVAEDRTNPSRVRTPLKLQWGRDEGVAEDSDSSGGGTFIPSASMGPRRGCRGRPDPSSPRRRNNTRLQWGRDEGVAEDCARSRPGRPMSARFNGAATRVSRKTPTTRLRPWRG